MTSLRSNAGFTLIETIMTIVLLSLGAVFLFSSFGTLLSNAGRTQQTLQAMYLAEEWAARASAAGYANPNVTEVSDQAVPRFPGFTRSRSAPAPGVPPGTPCVAGTTCEQTTTISVAVNGTVLARRTVTLYDPPP